MGLSFRQMSLTIILFMVIVFGCTREAPMGHYPFAPDFSLKDLSGNKQTLSDYKGRVVLLDFWATWCPPCRMSIPFLVTMQEKYKDKGFTVLGISTDEPDKVNDEKLDEFKNKFKMNYPVLRANDMVIRDYFSGMGGMSLPTMFVVDRDGRIKSLIVGFDPDHIQSALSNLME